jgi:hypothetical protein
MKYQPIQHKFIHIIVSVTFGLTALSASFALHAQTSSATLSLNTSEAATYNYAVQLYHTKSYSAAYGRFMRLADAGHLPSARMALAMLTHGQTLFNESWSATLVQQKQWGLLIQASTQGSTAITLSETGD